MDTHETLKRQRNPEGKKKKNGAAGNKFPDFRLFHKNRDIKNHIVLARTHTHTHKTPEI